MRVLVVGASGALGTEVCARLNARGYAVVGVALHPSPGVSAVNACSQEAITKLAHEVRPHAIVHCAGLVDVDYCERFPTLAWEANTTSVANVAAAARSIHSKLILMSTNGVFDGTFSLASELDPPVPINVYGRTKLAAEHAALRAPGSVIIRAAMLTPQSRSKVPFVRKIIDSLASGQAVQAYADVYDSPIHVRTVAAMIEECVRADITGLLHLSSERLSKYEFAVAVADYLHLPRELVRPVPFTRASGSAIRPRDTSLQSIRMGESRFQPDLQRELAHLAADTARQADRS